MAAARSGTSSGEAPHLPLALAGTLPAEADGRTIEHLFDDRPRKSLGGSHACLYFSKAQIDEPLLHAGMRSMMAADFR